MPKSPALTVLGSSHRTFDRGRRPLLAGELWWPEFPSAPGVVDRCVCLAAVGLSCARVETHQAWGLWASPLSCLPAVGYGRRRRSGLPKHHAELIRGTLEHTGPPPRGDSCSAAWAVSTFQCSAFKEHLPKTRATVGSAQAHLGTASEWSDVVCAATGSHLLTARHDRATLSLRLRKEGLPLLGVALSSLLILIVVTCFT
ncbi:hypothetical protein J3D46_000882 [Paenarthrobacter sp. A20]|nr:hypothetical protein [Paenarthrobacter sp. A20]